MATEIRGLVLATNQIWPFPSGIEWADRHASYGVAQEVYYTLGGNALVFARRVVGGRTITLQAKPDTCWIPSDKRADLLNFAGLVGAVYEFQWQEYISGVMTTIRVDVMFAHDQPPAIELEPLVPGASIYTGKIKFIAVSDARVSTS